MLVLALSSPGEIDNRSPVRSWVRRQCHPPSECERVTPEDQEGISGPSGAEAGGWG